MNLKTTFLLILLVGAGAGGWAWLHYRTKPDEATASKTISYLQSDLAADKVKKVEVLRGGRVGVFSRTPEKTLFTLERTGQEWNLPGKWPVRRQETEQWLASLSSLKTRFAPIVVGKSPALKPYGLDNPPLVLKVTVGDTTRTLRLGEEPGVGNRFSRATYVRLDDEEEVIRLGPGVVAALDRPLEYFKQRRLFPIERLAKDEDGRDKFEQLVAAEVEVEAGAKKIVLIKKEADWELKAAFKKEKDWLNDWEVKPIIAKEKDWRKTVSEDRLEPGWLKSFLSAFADLWAERFVEQNAKSLEEMGLKDPEFVIGVTRTSGSKMKLLVGKVSEVKRIEGTIPKPKSPFEPPMPPKGETVEEYRYAKLDTNNQVFEIKAVKLKDIASFESLRDPQLVRFKTDDVKRLEIQRGDETLVFAKIKDNDKEKWRIEKPTQEDAEPKQIEEVLEKLTSLRADDKNVLDEADLKIVGLDKPSGRIVVAVEEGKDEKKKKSREIVFQLGRAEKEKEKLYVRVQPWARVNQVNDELWKLVERPVLAYRNRRVLDLAAADLNKIEIQRADETYAFEKADADWKLAVPVKADVESKRVAELVSDLARIEGVDLITDAPKEDDLSKVYGLAKPALSATLHFKDAKKPAQVLSIGKQRDGKAEYYARIDKGPVFTVRKDLRDDLDRTSLSYRPLQLWQLDPDTITELTLQGESAPFTLKRDGKEWKVSGPFESRVPGFEAEDLVMDVARLRAERFEKHADKNLAAYGLDKPAYKLALNAKEKRVLDVGKKVSPTDHARFARLEGSEAIFVLDEKTIAPLKRNAFDLLDRSLLSLNSKEIERIRYQGAATFTLEPKGDQWQVIEGSSQPFMAEEGLIDQALTPLRVLRADKYVAYGAKIDWAQYGLDKPGATIAVAMKPDKDKKAIEHTIELGKESEGGRFARIDKKDAVALLDAKTIDALQRSHLDFADTRLLKFDIDAVTTIQRTMAGADIEIAKREDNWQILKPATRDADAITVGDILEKTFRLKAKRIAALPAKDLAPFGLDKPVAVVTLQTEAGKHVIKVGNLTKDEKRKETDERYAIIDDSKNVVVLSAELSRHVAAPVLYFADRNLASFSGVDTAILKRGAREATFARSDKWTMTAPIKTDAEDTGIEELIRLLQRLRADEIVGEKGADLKKYGLDQPLLQWRFKAGENDKLTLLVGGLENDKPGARRYAMLANQDHVFLLSAKLTAKATDEYRSRKPWGPLDAAQVEGLTITGPDGALTLRKRDTRWTIPGQDATVKTSVVTDTLDALASLKALRFEADDKADLQLFGLAKPAWKIDVQTPAGKRELLLGRNEGGSTSFYATVPGSNAVFVLDEETGARIARTMSAFVDAEKKEVK
jgi:hypothetical protein